MEDTILKALVVGLLGKEGWRFYTQTLKNRQRQLDAEKKEISSYRKDLLEENKGLKEDLKYRDSIIFSLHSERASFTSSIARYEEQIKGFERDIKRLKINEEKNLEHIKRLMNDKDG